MAWFRASLMLIVLGMLGMSTACGADPREAFSALEYTDAKGGKLLYRLMKPLEYDAKSSYPLVIFLHGAGERGSDNAAQLKHGMADFAADEARKKYPAFVLAPQCPNGEKWVNVDWSSPKSTMPPEPADSLRKTMELVTQLRKEFAIDTQRIYITGLSMGGYGSWDALQRYPDLFAAGAPICGGGDPAHAAKFKSVPLWVFHGAKDTAVKVERSREMVEALKAAGGSPKYTEYPNHGHDSWSDSYKNPEFHAWLFSQKKAAQ